MRQNNIFIKLKRKTRDVIIPWYYLLVNNEFIKDLWKSVDYEERKIVPKVILTYKRNLRSIDRLLYRNLVDEDKELFLRFFKKRYFDIDTAYPDEIKYIEEKFDFVKKLYDEQSGDWLKIDFRGNEILFPKSELSFNEKTQIANDVMNYYEIVHAFYLTEYEMEGFNPSGKGTILDCGAAHGDTLLMFKTLYPHAKVLSFENDAILVETAQKVIEKNELTDARIIKGFLYMDSEIHYLNMDTGMASIEPKDGFEKIKTVCIDDVVKEEKIDDLELIKMDIEGGEYNALLGAIKTIKRFRPILYIPIYHLQSDLYLIPKLLKDLDLKMEFKLKWTEKRVWGVDCVLFVRFI